MHCALRRRCGSPRYATAATASGITIGVVGGLIGIHWSLALSAMVLLAIIITLLTFSRSEVASGR